MKFKKLLIWLIGSFIMMGISLSLASFLFGPKDTCLDSGGCWDSVAKKCRSSEKYAQLLCHRSQMSSCDAINSCDTAEVCTSIPTLKQALCIREERVCFYLCGTQDCKFLESHPVQISCPEQSKAPNRNK